MNLVQDSASLINNNKKVKTNEFILNVCLALDEIEDKYNIFICFQQIII